jgi:hypothetical protein
MLLAILLSVGAAGRGSAIAQEASPMATPEAFSAYPALNVTYTAHGYQGLHDVPAGRTLITVAAETMPENENGFVLVKIDDKIQAALDAGEIPAKGDQTPSAFFSATLIGLGGSLTGGGHVVADLTPGKWMFLGYPALTTPSDSFMVTGEAPADQPAPTATVKAMAMDFGFSGLESGTSAGPQVWEFSNMGPEPHEFAVLRAPRALTNEQWLAVFTMEETATPSPDMGISMEELQNLQIAGGMPAISAGETVWAQLDLTPGDYVLICFISTPTGNWHPQLGMIMTFTVA